MFLHIYDMNNYARCQLEAPGNESVVFKVFNELDMTSRSGIAIAVWDGKHSLKKRKELYPAYKENRERTGESVYESFELMFQLLKLTNAFQLRVEGYEADDVIAHIVKKFESQMQIHIYSEVARFV